MENDLLAINSAQIIELNQTLAHIRNLSSLTFSSVNIALISHVMCHVTICSKKFLRKKSSNNIFPVMSNISDTSRLE